MESGKLERLNVRKTPQSLRPYRTGVTRAVTPAMLLRSLEALQESKLLGIFFSPMQVAQMVADMYPEVEQEISLLHQEVKDKLICAANADIIGFKIDRGYHVLTDQGCCSRIDTRSKLMFWMFYKKIVEERANSKKSKSKMSRSARSS